MRLLCLSMLLAFCCCSDQVKVGTVVAKEVVPEHEESRMVMLGKTPPILKHYKVPETYKVTLVQVVRKYRTIEVTKNVYAQLDSGATVRINDDESFLEYK